MTPPRKGGGPYLLLFALIGLLFVGILAVVYRITQKANPIMLDDHGRVQARP